MHPYILIDNVYCIQFVYLLYRIRICFVKELFGDLPDRMDPPRPSKSAESFEYKSKKKSPAPGKGLNSFPEPSGLEEGGQGG